MKKITSCLITVFLIFTHSLSSQNESRKDSTENFLLNFSVPDVPAFKALGTEASDISRPSDIQKFAVMLTPFYSEGKAVIPQNFAMEIAPWKLASKNWTLEKYNSKCNSILYNSGFSIGSIRDNTTNTSRLAVGYRFNITSSKGDILKNTYHLSKVSANMQELDQLIIELQNAWAIDVKKKGPAEVAKYATTHLDEFLKYISAEGSKEIQNNTMKLPYEKLMAFLKIKKIDVKKLVKDSVSYIKTRNADIDAQFAAFKKNGWNAGRTDIAIAWVASSSDTLLENAQFSSIHAWATQAFPIHKGGQLLLGVNAKMPRTEFVDSTDRKVDAAISMRYYVGTSEVRGFLETQYKYQNISKFNQTLLISFGAEFRVSKKFWVIASGGVNNYLGETKPFSKLVSSINVRYTFNEPDK